MRIVENKVLAATGGATGGVFLADFILYLLEVNLFHTAPDQRVVTFVYVTVAGLFAFAGGWLARHTPRPDSPVTWPEEEPPSSA